jgi:hypothetical protein
MGFGGSATVVVACGLLFSQAQNRRLIASADVIFFIVNHFWFCKEIKFKKDKNIKRS